MVAIAVTQRVGFALRHRIDEQVVRLSTFVLVWSPPVWHSYGMARIRVSTTVDESLLENARSLRSDLNDAALLDEALSALVGQHRAAEIDAGYAVYDEHPLDEADEWGDLATFRESAASS